jgi:hypothetical protein
MAHQRDLTDSWPPAALVEYLRAGPNEVSVSVLPRPRSTLPGGLIYLTQDEVLAQLAAGVGIDVGYGGRRENDLGAELLASSQRTSSQSSQSQLVVG